MTADLTSMRRALAEAERRVQCARLSFEQAEPATQAEAKAQVRLERFIGERDLLARAVAAAEGAAR